MIGYIVLATLMLLAGAAVGYLIRQNVAKTQLSTAEGQAAKMLSEAEDKVKELTIEAKNQAVRILEDAKKNEQSREEKIILQEKRIEKREEQVEKLAEEAAQLRMQVARVGGNLNQVSRRLNSGENVSAVDVSEALSAVAALRYSAKKLDDAGYQLARSARGY